MSKVILYIATSEDGFIADQDGGVDWLAASAPAPAQVSDDEMGYKALMERTSVILMGSQSYQQILGFGDWEWTDKITYVFTSKPLTTTRTDIKFTKDSVSDFMKEIKQSSGQDVWLLGGAKLVKSFAEHKLIDECIITIVPTILGSGIKLELPLQDFTLTQTKPCNAGVQQYFYSRKSP